VGGGWGGLGGMAYSVYVPRPVKGENSYN